MAPPSRDTLSGVRNLERFILRLDNGQTVRVESKLKELQAPTLIVWGTSDIFLDVQWSHWLAEGDHRRAGASSPAVIDWR